MSRSNENNSATSPDAVAWPDISYRSWRETCEALHLFLQIVGKYRLARSPWVNHSWHATFYVTSRGLTTALVPDVNGGIEIDFDFIDHCVTARPVTGPPRSFKLNAMSVAEFHRQFRDLIRSLGGTPLFHGTPNEMPEPVPFAEDTRPRPYDAAAVGRFHRALAGVNHVLQHFRTGFIGKVSPVHLFWGSFDLAVTRFSGRRAPLHPGGIPALPDEVTREAYSHEVSSAGFWPGGGPIDEAAFYSYAYPMPEGFDRVEITPSTAYFDQHAGEYLLKYDDVRNSADPSSVLMTFLESTYEAAARLGGWDRAALECLIGEPGKPRLVSPP